MGQCFIFCRFHKYNFKIQSNLVCYQVFALHFFSEMQKVSHYIIQDVNGVYFKIGDQRFADIPSIIEFYKKHVLDSTNLIEPVSYFYFFH